MAARRMLPVLVALSIGVVACGRGAAPTHVAAGGDPAPSSTTAVPATSAPEPASPSTTAPAAVTAVPATDVPPTTTAVVAADPVAGDPGASPVPGLDAAQLQAAVEAPQAGSTRAATGVTLDQVTLADGTRVWRVRIPGSFTARSARVFVTVGSRLVGEGVLARDLGSLTAITTDGTGLTAGQPVSYQWEGGPVVAAGRLAVIR